MSPKVKTIQMPIYLGKDKQNVAYPFSGLLSDNKIDKRKLIHVVTWMNLKNIMLSDRCQPQLIYITLFHLYKISKVGKHIETESTFVVD